MVLEHNWACVLLQAGANTTAVNIKLKYSLSLSLPYDKILEEHNFRGLAFPKFSQK